MKVLLSAEALDDIERLQVFLRAKSPSAARRAGEEIRKAARSLSDMHRGRPIHGRPYRELIAPFAKAAHVVRYLVHDDRGDVVVVRIWHSREQRV